MLISAVPVTKLTKAGAPPSIETECVSEMRVPASPVLVIQQRDKPRQATGEHRQPPRGHGRQQLSLARIIGYFRQNIKQKAETRQPRRLKPFFEPRRSGRTALGHIFGRTNLFQVNFNDDLGAYKKAMRPFVFRCPNTSCRIMGRR